jgi:hypothetical protein
MSNKEKGHCLAKSKDVNLLLSLIKLITHHVMKTHGGVVLYFRHSDPRH